MRWRQVASVLWLVGLAGCPHAFGSGGSLERAMLGAGVGTVLILTLRMARMVLAPRLHEALESRSGEDQPGTH